MGSVKETKKKQHERFLLDRFLERQGISPTGIQQLGPPHPDFVVDFEGRKVGIELTELFVRSKGSGTNPQLANDPLPQAAERFTDRVVSKALEIYLGTGNCPALANITFSSWSRSTRKWAIN